MYNKLSIFLVFAAVAQSSLALTLSSSCSTGSKIGPALAAIKFAEDTAREGYKRTLGVIHNEMVTVLDETFGIISTGSENTTERAELAETNSYQALLVGITPTVQTMALFQPDISVSTIATNWSILLKDVNANWYRAIKAAQGSNYTEATAEIAEYKAAALVDGHVLFGGMFDPLLEGTNPVPEEAETVVACYKSRVATKAGAAVVAVFTEAQILLDALFNITSQTDYDDYLSQLEAAHNLSYTSFAAEVVDKSAIIENLVLSDYLSSTGTVTGMFDIQEALKDLYA